MANACANGVNSFMHFRETRVSEVRSLGLYLRERPHPNTFHWICATDVDAFQRGSYLSLSLSRTMHKICTYECACCLPYVRALFFGISIFYCHALLWNWACKQRAKLAFYGRDAPLSISRVFVCAIMLFMRLLSITEQLTKHDAHTKFVFTAMV